MTRLINIDNGGTLTDFCFVDDGEVRYTKTLTTPYDLSRCLFDGLANSAFRALDQITNIASGPIAATIPVATPSQAPSTVGTIESASNQ